MLYNINSLIKILRASLDQVVSENLLLRTIENTFADAVRAIPPEKVRSPGRGARMIHDPKSLVEIDHRPSASSRPRRVFIDRRLSRAHRARANRVLGAESSLARIAINDQPEIPPPDRSYSIARARTGTTSYNPWHTSSDARPFYKSRYLPSLPPNSVRLTVGPVSFRFIT